MFEASLAILYVTDMEGALRFYRDALGGVVSFAWPEDAEMPDYAVISIGETRFGVGTYAVMHDLLPGVTLDGGGAEVELALRTGDVDRAVAHLRSHGAQVVAEAEDRPWGERAAWLRAPEGHLIQVYGPLGSQA